MNFQSSGLTTTWAFFSCFAPEHCSPEILTHHSDPGKMLHESSLFMFHLEKLLSNTKKAKATYIWEGDGTNLTWKLGAGFMLFILIQPLLLESSSVSTQCPPVSKKYRHLAGLIKKTLCWAALQSLLREKNRLWCRKKPSLRTIIIILLCSLTHFLFLTFLE